MPTQILIIKKYRLKLKIKIKNSKFLRKLDTSIQNFKSLTPFQNTLKSETKMQSPFPLSFSNADTAPPPPPTVKKTKSKPINKVDTIIELGPYHKHVTLQQVYKTVFAKYFPLFSLKITKHQNCTSHWCSSSQFHLKNQYTKQSIIGSFCSLQTRKTHIFPNHLLSRKSSCLSLLSLVNY